MHLKMVNRNALPVGILWRELPRAEESGIHKGRAAMHGHAFARAILPGECLTTELQESTRRGVGGQASLWAVQTLPAWVETVLADLG